MLSIKSKRYFWNNVLKFENSHKANWALSKVRSIFALFQLYGAACQPSHAASIWTNGNQKALCLAISLRVAKNLIPVLDNSCNGRPSIVRQDEDFVFAVAIAGLFCKNTSFNLFVIKYNLLIPRDMFRFGVDVNDSPRLTHHFLCLV